VSGSLSTAQHINREMNKVYQEASIYGGLFH
jgi:hypothetical protein